MSDLTATQRRTAAQNLASVWNDGKRRVVVTQRVHFRHDGQSITKDPTEVIDDPHTIALLEAHEIELIDLEVTGQPKRGKLLPADVDRVKNVDALAGALGVMPNLLHAAIESGGPHIDAAAKAVGETCGELIREDLSLADAIALLAKVADPYAAAVAHGAATILAELRGEKPRENLGHDAVPEWKPGDKE